MLKSHLKIVISQIMLPELRRKYLDGDAVHQTDARAGKRLKYGRQHEVLRRRCDEVQTRGRYTGPEETDHCGTKENPV